MTGAGAIRAGQAFVQINALDNTQKTLNSVYGKLQKWTSDLTKLSKTVITSSVYATLPIALATNSYIAFDDVMKRLEARAEGTAWEMQELRKQARGLGIDSGYSATEIGNMMDELGTKGFNRGEILQSAPHVANLARAAGEGKDPNTDLQISAKLIAGTMNAFTRPREDAQAIADALAGAANKTNLDLVGLETALSHAGPVAAEFKLTLEETLALIGQISGVNLHPSVAGTSLRNMMLYTTDLKEQVKLNTKLAEYKLAPIKFVDDMGDALKIQDILEDIQNKTKDMGSSEKMNLLANLLEMRATVPALVIMRDIKGFKELKDELLNSANAASLAAEKMNSGMGGAFRRLKATIGDAGIELIEVLEPAIISIVNSLKNATIRLTLFIRENKDLIMKIVTLIPLAFTFGIALFTFSKGLSFAIPLLQMFTNTSFVGLNLVKFLLQGLAMTALTTFVSMGTVMGITGKGVSKLLTPFRVLKNFLNTLTIPKMLMMPLKMAFVPTKFLGKNLWKSILGGFKIGHIGVSFSFIGILKPFQMLISAVPILAKGLNFISSIMFIIANSYGTRLTAIWYNLATYGTRLIPIFSGLKNIITSIALNTGNLKIIKGTFLLITKLINPLEKLIVKAITNIIYALAKGLLLLSFNPLVIKIALIGLALFVVIALASELSTQLTQFATEIPNLLSHGFINSLSFIGNLFGWLGTTAGSALSELWTSIASSTFTEDITRGLGEALKIFFDFGNELFAIFTDIWGDIIFGFNGIWETLKTGYQGVIDAFMTGDMDSAWKIIKITAESSWLQLISTLSIAWQKFANFMLTVWYNVIGAIKIGINEMSTAFAEASTKTLEGSAWLSTLMAPILGSNVYEEKQRNDKLDAERKAKGMNITGEKSVAEDMKATSLLKNQAAVKKIQDKIAAILPPEMNEDREKKITELNGQLQELVNIVAENKKKMEEAKDLPEDHSPKRGKGLFDPRNPLSPGMETPSFIVPEISKGYEMGSADALEQFIKNRAKMNEKGDDIPEQQLEALNKIADNTGKNKNQFVGVS